LNLVHLMEYIQTLPPVIKNDVQGINIYSSSCITHFLAVITTVIVYMTAS
jgi:hypothetical protein